MTSAPRSLRLTDHQRQTLAALADKLEATSSGGGGVAESVDQTIATRATAILMMEQGRERAEICRQLKLGHTELTRVRHRFLLLGLSGLHDVASLPPTRLVTRQPTTRVQAQSPESASASAPASSIYSDSSTAAPSHTAMPHLRTDNNNAANAAGRFQALRARLGISRPQLAQWLGVTRQYITKIEGGMPPSKPVMLLVERLEQEARQNGELTGKPRDVEPVSRGFAIAGAALENLSRTQMASKQQTRMDATTETLPIRRADGPGGDAPRTTAPEQVNAPVFAARSVPLLAMHEAADLLTPGHAATHGRQHLAFVVEDEQAFAVRITGEAMSPHYPEGSIAIVCPGLSSRNGDLVLARLKDERGGGTMLRLVHFIMDSDSLVLTSTHAAYPPLTVQKDDLLWLAPVTVSLRHLR